jgi:hypothetical protein
MHEAPYSREIVDLHQFFEDWFSGKLDLTDANFRRFESVIADGFALIDPGGVITERETLIPRLRAAHNTRPNVRVWIENIRLHHYVGDILLVTYEEWQESGDQTTARLSTALFRDKPDAPNGLEWLHVHETWLPDRAPA